MARALGVTRAGLSYHATKKLGLPSRAANRKCMARDVELFTAMWEARVGTLDIAQYFGMADRACASRRARCLGLKSREKGVDPSISAEKCKGGYVATITIDEFFKRRAEDGVIAMMDAIAARDAEARRERGLVA